MKRLWKWMGRIGREHLAREILAKVPEMSPKQLRERFSVAPDHRLLVGVLHVLRGMEELAAENVSMRGQDPYVTAHYAGGLAALGEAQERILDLVQQANEAMRGVKPEEREKTEG